MVSPAPLPVLRFSTAGLPPERQFEAFADAAGSVFAVDRAAAERRPGFLADLSAWSFGPLLLRRVRSEGPLRSARAARHPARPDGSLGHQRLAAGHEPGRGRRPRLRDAAGPHLPVRAAGPGALGAQRRGLHAPAARAA